MPLLYRKDSSIYLYELQGYIKHWGEIIMLAYIFISVSVVLFGMLIALFFISRKSQNVMQSMLTLITNPERAKVKQAASILQVILADEIAKIESNFNTIKDSLDSQIQQAKELYKQLSEQNDKIVTTADEATKKVAIMSQRLENTVSDLQTIIDSGNWTTVQNTTSGFATVINDLLVSIDKSNTNIETRINQTNEYINSWIENGDKLQDKLQTTFDNNVQQMTNITEQSVNMKNSFEELSSAVATGFDNVKNSAADYKDIMDHHDKMLTNHLTKLEEYSKLAKKQLTGQTNTLINTANSVGGQIRLVESSVEKQVQKLTDATDLMTQTATNTKDAVINITNELTTLTNQFNSEIKEFAQGIVGELKTVSGTANTTLENTKTAASKFSESVKLMATGVRETLIEMNTAHTQLSGQSENLIKMSADTTAKLQPLSELIEKYYKALPNLANNSTEINDNLTKIVNNLNEKIMSMKDTISQTTDTITESTAKLDSLSEQSRQQMIDLMSDYSKAVNNMQTLNKQIMVARATAPMDAINVVPTSTVAGISGTDFMKTIKPELEKLHEQSVDLTRAIGTEIPDIVWQKYHSGDKTIFSKWLAKMLKVADGKQIRELLKNDTVFRSQATQFVRRFDKILTAGAQTDTPDTVSNKLLKTDLGTVYTRLKDK